MKLFTTIDFMFWRQICPKLEGGHCFQSTFNNIKDCINFHYSQFAKKNINDKLWTLKRDSQLTFFCLLHSLACLNVASFQNWCVEMMGLVKVNLHFLPHILCRVRSLEHWAFCTIKSTFIPREWVRTPN